MVGPQSEVVSPEVIPKALQCPFNGESFLFHCGIPLFSWVELPTVWRWWDAPHLEHPGRVLPLCPPLMHPFEQSSPKLFYLEEPAEVFYYLEREGGDPGPSASPWGFQISWSSFRTKRHFNIGRGTFNKGTFKSWMTHVEYSLVSPCTQDTGTTSPDPDGSRRWGWTRETILPESTSACVSLPFTLIDRCHMGWRGLLHQAGVEWQGLAPEVSAVDIGPSFPGRSEDMWPGSPHWKQCLRSLVKGGRLHLESSSSCVLLALGASSLDVRLPSGSTYVDCNSSTVTLWLSTRLTRSSRLVVIFLVSYDRDRMYLSIMILSKTPSFSGSDFSQALVTRSRSYVWALAGNSGLTLKSWSLWALAAKNCSRTWPGFPSSTPHNPRTGTVLGPGCRKGPTRSSGQPSGFAELSKAVSRLHLGNKTTQICLPVPSLGAGGAATGHVGPLHRRGCSAAVALESLSGAEWVEPPATTLPLKPLHILYI